KSMLFATLDPTLRQLPLANGRSVILSDTVGFISDLPHELVEAFRATLDEVREADVILHVRDIASADSDAQSQDVNTVLEEIAVRKDEGRRILEVWNKIDLVDAHAREELAERAVSSQAAMISSVTGEGVRDLLGRTSA